MAFIYANGIAHVTVRSCAPVQRERERGREGEKERESERGGGLGGLEVYIPTKRGWAYGGTIFLEQKKGRYRSREPFSDGGAGELLLNHSIPQRKKD